MKPSKRIVAGIASAALVVGVGAGIADAAQKSSTPDAGSAAAGGPPPGRGGGRGPASAAIASYLGLDGPPTSAPQAPVGQDARRGSPTAQGKTVRRPRGRDRRRRQDTPRCRRHRRQAGPPRRRRRMLAGLKSHVDDMVNGVAPADGQRAPVVRVADTAVHSTSAPVTDYLGLTAAQLRTQQGGGQVARRHREGAGQDRGADSRTRSSPPQPRGGSTRTSRPASSRPRRRRRSSPT